MGGRLPSECPAGIVRNTHRTTPKLINRLCRYDILLIDELGYLTLNPEQINAFFKLMGERYGKKSTMITTNLDYPDWYELFKRKTLVDAYNGFVDSDQNESQF